MKIINLKTEEIVIKSEENDRINLEPKPIEKIEFIYRGLIITYKDKSIGYYQER